MNDTGNNTESFKIAENRNKTVTQPGRHGGTLKADAGPGRPKGSVSVTKFLKDLLEANECDQAKKLAQSLILNAAKGNGTAIKEVMSRIDGPIKQDIDLNSTVNVHDLSPEARQAEIETILAAIKAKQAE